MSVEMESTYKLFRQFLILSGEMHVLNWREFGISGTSYYEQ